jgi:ribosome-associated translation inhibitor RaiA
MSVTAFDVSVATHGPIGEHAAAYAEEKVRRACHLAPAPVLFARVALACHRNRSLERPYTAKATVDVGGRLVRAHVAAASATEAVDALESRLRRQLTDLGERREAHRRTGRAQAGEWRHGSLPAHRPEFFQRPPEERRVVRRKSYALAALTPEEAARELHLLDHDFHLFTDLVSADEAVVYRRPDGELGIQLLEGSIRAIVAPPFVQAAPAATMRLAEAIEELDLSGAGFVLFRDAVTRRGAVVYRRYDGHYGLVVPAS